MAKIWRVTGCYCSSNSVLFVIHFCANLRDRDIGTKKDLSIIIICYNDEVIWCFQYFIMPGKLVALKLAEVKF